MLLYTYIEPKNAKPSNINELHVFSLNIRSLAKNIDHLREEIATFDKFDVLCFNETNCEISKLPNGIDDIRIEGFYEPITQSPIRKSGKGGGLAIYINKRVCSPEEIENFTVGLDPEDMNGEFQLVKIHNCKGHNKTKVICNFYRSPSRDTKKFISLLENILRGLDRHSRKHIMFFGDANIDLIKYESDVSSQQLIETLEKYGLVQTVSKPTRVTDHSHTLIDHVYSNNIDNISSTNVLTIDISDHLATLTIAKLNCSSKNQRKSNKIGGNKKDAEIRIMNEACHATFKDLIEGETWERVGDVAGASAQYDILSEIYTKHYNTAYPLKNKRVRRANEREDPKPWILPWLESACARKNEMFFLKVTVPTIENKVKYKKLDKFCRKHVDLAKNRYYKKQFDMYQDNSKKQWRIINGLLNRNTKCTEQIRLKDSDGTILSSDQAVAEKFNCYFSNIAANIKSQIETRQTFDPGGFQGYLHGPCLHTMYVTPTDPSEIQNIISSLKNKATLDTKIEPLKLANSCTGFLNAISFVINTSFTEGVFPQALKTAKVVPIHKGGSKLDVANYRPISLLSSFSKIYEKLMHKRVLEFLDKNDSLFENQYGFRPGRSCEHALLNAQNSILQSLNKNQVAVLLLLDYSKAFDVLDHATLLKKLSHYGIRGVALKWFESYLSERKQFVKINSTQSAPQPIVYGVPQGSILGPLLFVIYINDLPGICNFAKFILYADDANIIITGTDLQEIKDKVDTFSTMLMNWVDTNGLSLNLRKTCYMIFSKKRMDLSSLQIRIDNTNIERKTEARFLGVIVDENLTWSTHIKAVKTKMSRFIGVMYKIKRKLPIKARLQIFNSLVQSQLNFCSLVWGFAAKSHIDSLFTKQKQGIRAIMTGYVNYRYQDGKPPDHTKSAFMEHEILTVHGVIVKNALILMHKIKNMPSKLPKSIRELFPSYMPEHGTSHDENARWLAEYGESYIRNSVFYKGPMLAVTKHNIEITCPSSIFSQSIYKKSAKRILLNLQNLGTGDEWPPFLLHNIPGLRKSTRTREQNFENDTIVN